MILDLEIIIGVTAVFSVVNLFLTVFLVWPSIRSGIGDVRDSISDLKEGNILLAKGMVEKMEEIRRPKG